MRNTFKFFIFSCLVVSIVILIIFILAKTSYVALPELPRQDPRAIGASTQLYDPQALEGPILLSEGEEQVDKTAAQKIPVPMFWMAAGALCAGVGILIATRDKKPKGVFYVNTRRYR